MLAHQVPCTDINEDTECPGIITYEGDRRMWEAACDTCEWSNGGGSHA